MSKIILFGQEAREKLLKGTDLLARAVGSSLGARGNNTGIDYGYSYMVVHDGVTIAREVDSDDPAIRFGIKVLREAANKQVSTVGDGTTVVTILGHEIFKEAYRNVAAGTNAMTLKQGLEEGRDILLAEIKKLATPVKTRAQAIQVATISAGESSLGEAIGGEAFDLGVDGIMTEDESPTGQTYVERQEGLQFEKGYIAPQFITDVGRMEATVENAKILLTDKVLANVNELIPLMEQVEKANVRSLTVVAQDVVDSALASLVLTKVRGGMNILVVKAPYTGQAQKDFLDDVAILTGGVVVSEQEGRNFTTVKLEELGEAQRVTSTSDATLIVNGKGDKKAIAERIEALKLLQTRKEGSDYEREKIKERYAKLTKGVGVVKVGGVTEIEIKERMERAKDAVAATQAALRSGVVAGGETVYLRARNALDRATLAHNILYQALEKPFAKLLANAGLKPDSYLSEISLGAVGVDVTTGNVEDLFEIGIIDPALVSQEALSNAISTAIALVTTEVLILPREEKDGNR